MRALRALLAIIVLVVLAFVAYTWWGGTGLRTPIGTSGDHAAATSGSVDVSRARERGAEVGEQAAKTAAAVREGVAEAAVTSKIKAKMALDDQVRARSVDVSTSGTTVTLSGTVRSAEEHDRVVALARETNGVSHVVDRLAVRP